MKNVDVVVIGAGAAGLMCALTAAKRGKSVCILDKSKKIAEKIRISGGGRCNFTNIHTAAHHFLSHNPHFCKSALAGYSQHDFIDWVKASNIAYHERDHGQLFCDSSASQIIDMLVDTCKAYGVHFHMGIDIQHIEKKDKFIIQTQSMGFESHALVVATGGLSIPKIGATSFGFRLAEQFGLRVVAPRAGLVPFMFTGKAQDDFKRLAGIALPVLVKIAGKTHKVSFEEAMLFTHRGLSGPAMLQISSYWLPGDNLEIDVLPRFDVKQYLVDQCQSRPQAQLATVLSSCLPKRLVQIFSDALPLPQKLGTLTHQDMDSIGMILHKWAIKPSGTEGYRTAEVTVGGVDTRDLSSQTMQAKQVDHLYFIGEVVDVTGHLGGFNFQWAWSSAHCAGSHL